MLFVDPDVPRFSCAETAEPTSGSPLPLPFPGFRARCRLIRSASAASSISNRSLRLTGGPPDMLLRDMMASEPELARLDAAPPLMAIR